MPATKTRQVHHRRLSPAPAFRTPMPNPACEPRSPSVTGTPTRSALADPEGGEGKVSLSEPGEGPSRSGPRTPEGKAVASRNATTHGLFCRQTVLPELGEDPDGYRQLLQTLESELRPNCLMDKQYLELWADASWKMRRLSRWEAQLWEQQDVDEDERLRKLERVMRLQTTLRRQLDKAVHMLNRDVPQLYASRAHQAALRDWGLTERDCRENPQCALNAEEAAYIAQHFPKPYLADSQTAARPPPSTPPASTPPPSHKFAKTNPPLYKTAASPRQAPRPRGKKIAKTNPPPRHTRTAP